MTDAPPPSSDRRRAVRHVACFPSYVAHESSRPPAGDASAAKQEEEKITAMISDLAETGTLLLVRGPEFRVGDQLRLELHLMLDKTVAPRSATGHVVRVELLPEERTSLWTHQVGVEFHDKLELSPAEIDALDKRQLPFGPRK